MRNNKEKKREAVPLGTREMRGSRIIIVEC